MLSPFRVLPILELLSRNTRQPSRYALLPRAQPRTKRILARLSPGVGSSFGDWSPLSCLSLSLFPSVFTAVLLFPRIYSPSLSPPLPSLTCSFASKRKDRRVERWTINSFYDYFGHNLWYGLQDGKNFLGAWLTVYISRSLLLVFITR